MNVKYVDLSTPVARKQYHRELEKMRKKEAFKEAPLKAAIIFFFGYGLVTFGLQVLHFIFG